MQPTLIIQAQNDFKELVDSMVAKGTASDAVRSLKANLDAGTVKLIPYSIYSRVLIGGSNSVDFFDPTLGKNRTLGTNNLDNGKLENGRFFMPLSIQLGAVTQAGIAEADLTEVKYASIAALANGSVVNGEISISTQNFPILKDLANKNFDMTNNANVRVGEFYLPTRRLIEPQQEILGTIKSPAGKSFVANTALEVLLHGVATVSLKSV